MHHYCINRVESSKQNDNKKILFEIKQSTNNNLLV